MDEDNFCKLFIPQEKSEKSILGKLEDFARKIMRILIIVNREGFGGIFCSILSLSFLEK